MKDKLVREGVAEGVEAYLENYPISTPAMIIEGVEKAASKWLNEHGDELIEAIAKAVAKQRLGE